MAVFHCAEIRPIKNSNAYLARKDELLIKHEGTSSGDDILCRCTGNHLLVFSIRTADRYDNTYRFYFEEYLSEIAYIANLSRSTNRLQTIERRKNIIRYFNNQDKVLYGDNSVSSLIARMTLADKYDLNAITDRFSPRCSNYSFSWDYPKWDVPALGKYRHKMERIGILLHIDKNGNFYVKPSEHNVVVKFTDKRKKDLWLDCFVSTHYKDRELYEGKKFITEFSPYSIDRYKILYDALISVFNIESINKEG